MAKFVLTDAEKRSVADFLQNNQGAELADTYLHLIQFRFGLQPVLYPKGKMIYQSADDAVRELEKEGKLWHETEIKIGTDLRSVNEQTRKIYICPFTGKVFGDNTHPNPQDAIYDWVSKCPENTERVGGLKAKRFFVSEDPEVIKNYVMQTAPKTLITKVVYSSVMSGKLFNSKESIVADFRKNYLKSMTLEEVQAQNRFNIETRFLEFLQQQLVEDKITAFVEALAEEELFLPYVSQWVEAE